VTTLLQQRCFNHAMREAAVRCPDCKRYFCRECVTEHAGRMLCASCLVAAAQTKTHRTRARLRTIVLRPLQVGASVCLVWLVFYTIGQGLLRIPDMFHEEDTSQADVWDDAK